MMEGRPGTCPVLHGRCEELALLVGARRNLARSRGSIVLLGGEPGIGKSRLLAEFMADSAAGRPRFLATLRCAEGRHAPFGTIRALLGAFENVAASAPFAPAFDRVIAALRSPHAGEGDVPAPPDKATLFAALFEYFKRLGSRRATILAIDDLQCASPTLLEFIAFLAPKIAGIRVLLTATYRSDQVEHNAPLFGALARIMRPPSVRNVRLGPLHSHEIEALLTCVLGNRWLPAAAVRDIEARCEGNPFFAEELLSSALQSGSAEALPHAVRAAIRERLVAVREDDRHVLAQAAVLGARFEPQRLGPMMRRSFDDVAPALRRARDANLVVEEASGAFRFRSTLTWRAIYEDIPADEVERSHEAARALGYDAAAAPTGESGAASSDGVPVQERSAAHVAAPRVKGADLLSQREGEIAALAASGLTNDAIAFRLAISPKTVEKHLSSIFAKLAIRSRAQLARSRPNEASNAARER